MTSASNPALITNAVGLALVGLLTILPFWPASRSILSTKTRRVPPTEGLYQDEDGIASKDSETAFSSKIQCFVLFISTLSGACIALASAALFTAHLPNHDAVVVVWLQFASWVSRFYRRVGSPQLTS
jgi:hypothetical protein